MNKIAEELRFVAKELVADEDIGGKAVTEEDIVDKLLDNPIFKWNMEMEIGPAVARVLAKMALGGKADLSEVQKTVKSVLKSCLKLSKEMAE